MPFRSRRGSSVRAQKHTVTGVSLGVAAGALTITNFVVPATTDNGTTDVDFAARISNIYYDITIDSTVAMTPCYWAIIRQVGSSPTGTVDPQTLTTAQQRFVMAQGQGIPINTGMPIRFMGWAKVPRTKRTMQRDDAIYLVTKGVTNTHNECYKFIYKSYL